MVFIQLVGGATGTINTNKNTIVYKISDLHDGSVVKFIATVLVEPIQLVDTTVKL